MTAIQSSVPVILERACDTRPRRAVDERQVAEWAKKMSGDCHIAATLDIV